LDKEVLQTRTSALFDANNVKCFEIYGVLSGRTRGGVNFLRFCADVFYERPLMLMKLKVANAKKLAYYAVTLKYCTEFESFELS